jgi:hypothetical protein
MVLHLLLVPHATCEHGDLVEAVAPSSHTTAAVEARADEQQVERADAQRDGHEHCDALAVRHRLPEVGPHVACASLVWIAPSEPFGEHREARPVPLLALAPKGSPPV